MRATRTNQSKKEALVSINRRGIGLAALLASFAMCLCVTARAEDFPGGVRDTLGPQFGPASRSTVTRPPPRRGTGATERLHHWNRIAIDASGLDHTPVAAGENRVFGEQFGPGRSSRAMAIVHIAMFDAVNAIVGGYESYTGIPPASVGTSVDAAMAVAAHDTLVALFPSQAATIDAELAEDLRGIRPPRASAITSGIELGHQAAAAILALRADDGSQHSEPRIGVGYMPGDEPGEWRPDPISQSPLALGALWGAVKPFVLRSGKQFRVVRPPLLASPEYAVAFDEVKRLGGDGIVTPTQRTAEQTEIGIFWAYDGTPSLCAPPRLYNQIAMQIADQRSPSVIELARLMALVNVAMADAGIAIWESKYYYEFWRPVTAIRESDPGTGPTAEGDGSALTLGNASFTPLGAPASNLTGPNFTPPFPAYPSGHAGFGGALFQMLRNFLGTDAVPFTFISDEFNGATLGNDGEVRPIRTRSFASLAAAEEENGQSRIYLGIHWAFDKTEGIAQGHRVADYVFGHAFVPVRDK
jgi:hypothetical protein